ncbi:MULTISPECIES: thioredoxin family protein [Lysinibacillus]|uniref:Thioredoxin n=1 Tax=Lysinibacillus antri TaxID=2498145 RepID=A0A432L7Q5_9BACI|nr:MULTISPECIES: thioredoxin family protein [Lysinibacillus]RUL48039.1 thioredoxin [Lysinibacillus antri]TSI06863.1 thioredoxin family protein [Lysinibacillus sp. BW-2-10]
MQEWTIEQWEQNLTQHPIVAFYLYTPMCGTCAVASKMLEVVENVLPDVPIGKANINFIQSLAMDYQIESVPCLVIGKSGNVVEKLYAFQSVPNLYEKLKK